MKKKKMIKEEKKKEEKFKSKWKTWMTIVVTIASIFVISGATVLGVYLAGGFEEENTMPESINFLYDDDLFNSERMQLEVGKDFQLTITSPTSQVTRRKVELSFGGDVVTDYDPVNQLISNKSIQVPKYVSLGKPFSVHLLSNHLEDENGNPIKDSSDNYINWIAGGISTLVARSENIEIGTANIKIAVDVPVYSTQTLVYNSKGELTNQVVRNESFTMQTKYIPKASKWMYSDEKSGQEQASWREKYSYYEAVNTQNITAVYDGKHSNHFVASNQAADNVRINGYTFSTAKAQLDYDLLVGEIEDVTYYYTGVLTYLSENSDNKEIAEESYAEVSIGEENIGNFTVSKVSQTISMNVESPLNLYLNQYPYQSSSDYLGVRVYSSSGLLLDNLLKNIVISFDFNGVDPTWGNNKILNIEGDKEMPYIDIDGKRYYRPNSNVNDIRYSNWKLTATEAIDLKINVALLVNENTELFADANGQPMISQVNLSISKHEEKPLSWVDNLNINILLNYQVIDGESKIKSETIDLNRYSSVSEENIYQDKVYFVWFGDGPLADYVDMANRIIGEDGYILERSGKYQTNDGRMATLFAVNGSRLTLYNTGEFSLYFATIRPGSAEGLYDIAEMCSSTKEVISKTALYSNSIKDFYLEADNFIVEDEQEISINLGSNLDFGLHYTIAAESVPVFKDEFQKGFIRPVIYDMAGNDISEYFIFSEGAIFTNDETKAVSVQYRVSTKASVQLDNLNGLYLGYISLIYENEEGQAIEWKRALNTITDKLVNIYKPKAVRIDMATKSAVYEALADENAKPITVDQNLTQEGGFNTIIKVTLLDGTIKTFNNVTEFINDIVGANGSNFVIVDQKGNSNTLKNQWKFMVQSGNSNIINILPNGQSFAFKNTNSNSYIPLSLIVKSNDENATLTENENAFEIQFEVKSTGISKVKYDAENKNTYEVSLTTESSDTSKEVIVNKYGAVGNEDQFINLKDLIRIYCLDEEGKDVEFSLDNVNFKFTSQYYSETRMTDRQILDMFGSDGMVTLYDSNDQKITFTNTADTIRQALANIIISKIKINKNFASPHYMEFSMSDVSGAVNIMFSLQLLQNFNATNENYVGKDSVYAGLSNKIALKNTYVDFNKNAQGTNAFNQLFDKNKNYYIIANNEGRYVVVASDTKPVGAIGTYNANSNEISFEDFWEVATKNFTIYFQPEGNNSFALSHPIQFEVKRDIKIADQKGTFYILGDGSQIGDFVLVTRHNDQTIEGVTFSFDFDDYLQYKDGKVVKKENANFFFDYNQKSLWTTMIIKHGNTTFGQIDIEIQLLNSQDDIYSILASSFTLESNDEFLSKLKPQSQIIGDVNYLMFARNVGPNWSFGNLYGYEYNILPTTRDYFGNNYVRNLYESDSDNSLISFKSQVEQKLFYGLDDTNSYLVLQIRKDNNVLAFMHIPMLVSNIGYDIVVYENYNKLFADDRHRVETALADPENLIEMGIYNEIEAGKLSQILSQYNMAELVSEMGEDGQIVPAQYRPINKGGLYTIGGAIEQQLNVYIFENKDEDYSNLLNSKLITKIIKNGNSNNTDDNTNSNDKIEEFVGYITLNHLNKEDKDVYLAFEYVVDSYGKKQTFYYLLKVVADVEIDNSIYAYNGSAEHISGDSSAVREVNLEELFDEKTLNKDKKRFVSNKIINLKNKENQETELDCLLKLDIKSESKLMFTYEYKETKDGIETTKYKEIIKDFKDETEIDLNAEDLFNGFIKKESGSTVKVAILKGDISISYQNEKLFETLKYKNEIVSVEVGSEGVMTDSEEWGKSLEAYFSSDYSTLYYRPFGKYANSKMTITIKHSYLTTDEDKLSVVGGEQTYTLILNEDSEIYSVRFTDKDGKVSETDELKLSLKNGEVYNDNVEGYEGKNVYKMQVDLLKKEAGNINTIVRDKLNVGISEGKENIESFNYNPSNGILIIVLKDYVDSDKNASFAVYTSMGYLASINLDLKANIEFTPMISEINGGSTINLKDTIKLTEDASEISEYTIADITISGQGKDLVKYENGQLIISDLISDKDISIDFVVKFNKGEQEKEFKFSHQYTLRKNITPKGNIAVSDETIAGRIHEFDIYNLFDFINDSQTSLNTQINVECQSSNPAFGGISVNGNLVEISTNYVSDKVTLELTLKVTLTFEQTSQEFNVRYSFVVAPSVKLESSYPVPNSNGMMKFEYIDNNTTFADIKAFLNANPIFGEAERISFYQAELLNGDKFASYNKKLETINNDDLTVILNSKTDNADLINGETTIPVNGQIDANNSIKFVRTGGNSGDASIQLSITYQSVNIVYNIRLLGQSLSIVQHTVSNYTLQGEYEEDSVSNSISYEKIYVDKTNTENLFVGERLLYASLNDTMAYYADEYYFVFSGEDGDDKLYASYPIYITDKDQSSNRYYDLGVSFEGKTFVGIYTTSSFEQNNIGIGDNRVVEDPLDNLTNLANQVFKMVDNKPQVALANRAQMTYGVDEEGNEILVDIKKYNSIFKGNYLTLNLGKNDLDKINKNEFRLTFNKNDGSTSPTKEFNFNYYYMGSFDIDVKEKGNIVEVEVNDTIESLNDLLGIHHPTTKRKVAASDFTSADSGLGFELIYYAGEESSPLPQETKTLLNNYMNTHSFNAYKRFVEDDGGTQTTDDHEYIFIGPTLNDTSGGRVYDYELIPFGAKNIGDYVLGKVTYKVNNFETDFYVVIKIMPDYAVSFNGNTENGQNELDEAGNQIRSNIEPHRIEYLQTANEYRDFNLTGEQGYMTIKHKNGTGEKQDLSTKEFSIKLTEEKMVKDISYNIPENLASKIFYNTSAGQNNNSWVKAANDNYYSYNAGETAAAITFSKVKAVIFGNQNYYIEGEDAYGYKFRLYFTLIATEDTPAITNSITIMEEDYIDLVIEQYKNLSIKNNNNDNYMITAQDDPVLQNDSKVNILKFEGIDAWQFVENYTVAQINDGNKIYLDKSNSADTAYTAHKEAAAGGNQGYEININQGANYLKYPMIDKITVENIKLYDPDTNQLIETLVQKAANTANWSFATNGAGYFGNEPAPETATEARTAQSHRAPRAIYGKQDGEGAENDYSDHLYQLPKLTQTGLYKNGDSVPLRLVVKLKYQANGIVEYCDCPINITVNRKVILQQTDNRVVRDGQAFALSDKLEGRVADGNEQVNITGFVNDTIEVLVKGNSRATFDIALTKTINGEKKEYKNTIQLPNTSSNIATTKYESISAALGVYVEPDDEITISNVKDALGIYYITNTTTRDPKTNLRDIEQVSGKPTGQVWEDGDGNATFKIAKIDQDVVFVEDASLLGDYSYSVTKHYIAQCEFGSKTPTTPETTADESTTTPANQTYNYRVSADYEVTGFVYNLKKNYSGEIGFTINSTYTENSGENPKWSPATFAQWNSAFSLYNGITTNGGKIEVDLGSQPINKDVALDYLSFKLDNKGGETSLGNATIDADGTIQLSNTFTPNQYIRVVVLMKVSGQERDAANNEGTKVILGELNLSTITRVIP